MPRRRTDYYRAGLPSTPERLPLDTLRSRALRTLLTIVAAIYSLSVITALATGDLGETVGEVLAMTIAGVGAALVSWPPVPPWRHRLALVLAGLAVPAATIFHELTSAQIWAVVAPMVLAMYLRTFYRTTTARMMVAGLSAVVVAALALAPAPIPWLWYVVIPAAIIGASETFGSLTTALTSYAVTDPLTGVANRSGPGSDFESLRQAVHRRGGTLTAIVLDVDDFKSINDTGGHKAGDNALVGLAAALADAFGDAGVVARLGGDEFLIVADRPIDDCADQLHRLAADLPMSVSAGFAEASAASAVLSDLIDEADDDLYRRRRSHGHRMAADDLR